MVWSGPLVESFSFKIVKFLLDKQTLVNGLEPFRPKRREINQNNFIIVKRCYTLFA